MNDRDLPSHPAGLAWEIATSPIVMHGRSAAQPRVGTHKCQLFSNYLRYSLEILTQYGGTCRPISVPKGELNWFVDGTVIGTDALTHSPPTQTLFLP